ncbi:hypothetical protein GCM10007420_24860 [Glycocaulis albus]|uniref:Uncharacterized protein n=1 Tax=Glycocaulis albus TaxID=1382801 RepID=A0ABQ1XYP9_9PROT|nr:hypothetical protein [Glycocaulis albus]MBV5258067.1 hypothetical protein [Synechococcus moorigangaii CMS01]GGH07191.1 hypothetical protein GCM10007420_24860 [Glycocaulis albus]
MGRSVETRNWRITSERIGSVDWQDAMESFALYAALVEDEGAREVLMNMSGAEILISHSEAPELARMFARETPAALAIAIVRPSHNNDARFIEVFTEELKRAGRTVGLFQTLEEADAFLLAERQNGAGDVVRSSSPLDWLKRLIAG